MEIYCSKLRSSLIRNIKTLYKTEVTTNEYETFNKIKETVKYRNQLCFGNELILNTLKDQGVKIARASEKNAW